MENLKKWSLITTNLTKYFKVDWKMDILERPSSSTNILDKDSDVFHLMTNLRNGLIKSVKKSKGSLINEKLKD